MAHDVRHYRTRGADLAALLAVCRPADGTRAVRQAEKAADDLAAPRRWTWRMLLTNRTFWAMSLSILLSSYYWYFVLTWVPSYLILSRGFSTLGMGRVVSTALFTMAVVNVFAGAAADRLAARIGVFRARLWFGVVGYVGTAAILLLLVTDRSWALPILTFSMCATGIGNSNFWTISQHVPPKNLVGRTDRIPEHDLPWWQASRRPLLRDGYSGRKSISDRRFSSPACVLFWPPSVLLAAGSRGARTDESASGGGSLRGRLAANSSGAPHRRKPMSGAIDLCLHRGWWKPLALQAKYRVV